MQLDAADSDQTAGWNSKSSAIVVSLAAMNPATLFVALFLLSALVPPQAFGASAIPTLSVDAMRELPTLVRQADLIVAAKVLGMVDSAPDANRRKEREVHRVRVQTTLQGFDETGRTLLVNPRGMLLADGESYVFFLRRLEGNLLEALGRQLVGASDRNLDLIRKEVASRGNAVHPGRVLWVRHSGGWQREPDAEFFVDGRNHFEWTTRDGSQTRIGTLPAAIVQDLIAKVRAASPGPITDDAGMVSFHWVDPSGEVVTKTFHAPATGPGAELLATIARLARQHGETGRNPK